MSIHKVIKPVIFLVCLWPLWTHVNMFLYGDLANPVEYITRATGDWALRFLLIVLAVTPVKILTRYNPILRYRRMLGLYAFFYVCVHFSIYCFLDILQNADDTFLDTLIYIGGDIVERPYITIGFTAFLMLIPLAVTSTQKFRRTMGKKWIKLHKLVYVIGVLGVVHYFWLVKKDLTEPLIYGSVLTVLFLIRIVAYYRKKLRARAV